MTKDKGLALCELLLRVMLKEEVFSADLKNSIVGI